MSTLDDMEKNANIAQAYAMVEQMRETVRQMHIENEKYAAETVKIKAETEKITWDRRLAPWFLIATGLTGVSALILALFTIAKGMGLIH